MARPIKSGLDYFPVNVNISEDEKMEIIEAEFGPIGFYVIIKTFMRIYEMDGYYMMFTEREQKLFSKRINVDINEVIAIINSALKEGFFDKNLYEKYEILTSKGIQKRYLEAINRRTRVEFIKEYLLIEIPESDNFFVKSVKNDENVINDNNNSINDNNNINIDDNMYSKNTQIKENYNTKLNYIFNLIIDNKNEPGLKMTDAEFAGLKMLLKRLEVNVSRDTLALMPIERQIEYKVIYMALLGISINSYKIFLNYLTPKTLYHKLIKTKEHVGKLENLSDSELKCFVGYFIVCLQNFIKECDINAKNRRMESDD